MEIHYEKYKDGIRILSCHGSAHHDGCIILPDTIDDLPVIALAPYAFSNGDDPADYLAYKTDEDFFGQTSDDFVRLKTTDIVELHLPKRIREIGHYAFYRCSNLRKLVFADEIMEIGGGALNGCRALREVEIHHYHGERSALKSIVDEIRFEIDAKLYYYAEGETREAHILFPEHYEEAVENTPARLLYTTHHGAGGYYRQCFYNREIDFQKYDERFPWAVAGDSVVNVLRLAFLRLQFPYKLSEKAKQSYEAFVKEHLAEAAAYFVENELVDQLLFITKNEYWTEEALSAGVEAASEWRKTGILSLLMDEKKKLFPKKRKKFEL